MNETTSPFHPGEQAIQNKLGVRDQMERFGRQVIVDYLPEQHRHFYPQLPYVFIGHVDHAGRPWASILFNDPGFMVSPDPKQLVINARPVVGDPLVAATIGDRIGVLGIELSTRRRNRLCAKIRQIQHQQITLTVDQAFGNCPQYIQARKILPREPQRIETSTFCALDQTTQALIERSDTFFVASHLPATQTSGNAKATEGTDISHRGGKPGFIRVDDARTLTIPDYRGNFHFNTLGNFIQNPVAGLLFIDFQQGDIVMLTGTVELIWASDELPYFEGAERLWTFTLTEGRKIRSALPFDFQLESVSPNTALTGTWQSAQERQTAEQKRQQWQAYEVVKIHKESDTIQSLYCRAQSGCSPVFQAGQFLTLKHSVQGHTFIRTYTVSNAPSERMVRISVKREGRGGLSDCVHDTFSVGQKLLVKAPSGLFTLNKSSDRPVLMLAAGIGITPLLAMLQDALNEGIRTRQMRSITLVYAARNQAERAFMGELNLLQQQSAQHVRCVYVLSQPEAHLQAGRDYHYQGHINAALIQAILPSDDYDAYLCGPADFMQQQYDSLISQGAKDDHIYAESFGPASLKRQKNPTDESLESIADEAIVEFMDGTHSIQQYWSAKAGNLLEFAEAHGLQPQFGCRNGHCGSCKAKLVSGAIYYIHTPSVVLEDDDVLLCCAVPAKRAGGNLDNCKIRLDLS